LITCKAKRVKVKFVIQVEERYTIRYKFVVNYLTCGQLLQLDVVILKKLKCIIDCWFIKTALQFVILKKMNQVM